MEPEKGKSAGQQQARRGQSTAARKSDQPQSLAKEAVLDATLHALADPARRRIVALLRESGELRVSDLAAAFAMSLNGVSKHIKVLEKANLIQRRVDGRVHWLAMNWATLQIPYEWFHAYQHFWSGRLDQLVDFIEQGAKDNE